MAKLIPLSQSKFAIVDDEDFEKLNGYKWFANKRTNIYYAGRWEYKPDGKKMTHMHRIILNVPDGFLTDHIDGNGLNNQKYNLRPATNSMNQFNRHRNNRLKKDSNYPGVSKDGKSNKNKWRSQIRINGILRYLGSFPTEEEVYRIYRETKQNKLKSIEDELKEILRKEDDFRKEVKR